MFSTRNPSLRDTHRSFESFRIGGLYVYKLRSCKSLSPRPPHPQNLHSPAYRLMSFSRLDFTSHAHLRCIIFSTSSIATLTDLGTNQVPVSYGSQPTVPMSIRLYTPYTILYLSLITVWITVLYFILARIL